MTIPNVTNKIQDGALGVLPASNAFAMAVLGVSSLGTVNTLYSFGGNDPSVVPNTLGTGPLPEAVAYLLTGGGGPVYAMPVNASVVGTAAGVVHTGPGACAVTVQGAITLTSTTGVGVFPIVATASTNHNLATGDVVTIAGVTGNTNANGSFPVTVLSPTTFALPPSVIANGTGSGGTATKNPLDAYSVILTIVAGGTNPAAGTATFTYSMDGGVTTSPVTAVPTSGAYVLPGVGITLLFSAASLVAGDTYTIACSAPSYGLTDLSAAMTALLAISTTWKCVWIVGSASSGTGAATIAAGVDTLMTTAESNKRYTFALMSARDTDAALITAFASFTSRRTSVSAGTCTVLSALSGRAFIRDAMWPVALRLKGIDPGTDAAQFSLGTILGVTALQRDEQATPGLDAKGFTTLRTFPGVAGFYITNANIMAPTGSDFGLVVRRAVMDQACAISYTASLQFLNAKLRVNRLTGYIDERDARAWETYVNAQLAAGVVSPNYAIAATLTVNRNTNVLSTGAVQTQIQILPYAYPNTITNTIGFVNPAIAQAG